MAPDWKPKCWSQSKKAFVMLSTLLPLITSDSGGLLNWNSGQHYAIKSQVMYHAEKKICNSQKVIMLMTCYQNTFHYAALHLDAPPSHSFDNYICEKTFQINININISTVWVFLTQLWYRETSCITIYITNYATLMV